MNTATHLILKTLDVFNVLGYLKRHHELKYWKGRVKAEKVLGNDDYRYFFTNHFNLSTADYEGKRVLDIGCGPRGSLEWAHMASDRIGLDPLADKYLALGADLHRMRYITAPSETIPFEDGYFDIVTSFNSIDHVDDLDATVAEIIRVLAPGGTFLLLSQVNLDPTICEPHTLTFELAQKFVPSLTIVQQREYERSGTGMYESIRIGMKYDHGIKERRAAVLSAMFTKKGSSRVEGKE